MYTPGVFKFSIMNYTIFNYLLLLLFDLLLHLIMYLLNRIVFPYFYLIIILPKTVIEKTIGYISLNPEPLRTSESSAFLS